jgi:tetratricopeptide (TPR) repeat protein
VYAVLSRRPFRKAAAAALRASTSQPELVPELWRVAIAAATYDEEVVVASGMAAQELEELGRGDDAAEFLLTVVERSTRTGNYLVLGQNVNGRDLRIAAFETLIELAEARKDWDDVRLLLLRQRDLALTYRDKSDAATAAALLGNVVPRCGLQNDQVEWYATALDEFAGLGDRRQEAHLWGALGQAARHRGDLPRALNALSWAQQMCVDLGRTEMAAEYSTALDEVRNLMRGDAVQHQ